MDQNELELAIEHGAPGILSILLSEYTTIPRLREVFTVDSTFWRFLGRRSTAGIKKEIAVVICNNKSCVDSIFKLRKVNQFNVLFLVYFAHL